jgi:prepilin-type N-terminal cleavage/methylation domain-containing protein
VKYKSTKGFTLLELLTVISIIALIANSAVATVSICAKEST